MKQHFLSDNASPAHPDVLAALVEANDGYEIAYGQDTVTNKAQTCFKEQFGDSCAVFFTSTGTASNVIALKSVLAACEAVLCADSAHLYRDECAAPEALLGTKLIPVKSRQGKISPEMLVPFLKESQMVHRVQPRVVSISQCTEWGTVYTLEEMQALSDFCRKNNLLLHVDGARLANAACFLKCSLKEICLNGAIDILSFGGTKNGLMGAEAVVLFNPELATKASFIHKQLMQLSSKMRYISAQFLALFNDNLWQKNAMHANRMAKLLVEELEDTVEIVMPVQTNVIFATLPSEVIEPLQANFPFALWQPADNIVRWMTSYDTSEVTVRAFARQIKEMMHDYA